MGDKRRRLKIDHRSVYDSHMQSIRSFVAIPLPTGVRSAAARLIHRIRDPGDGIKWVPTDNLHLTLKFLGDVENVQIPEVCDRIREACGGVPPFELRFAGTGAFPSLERPRTLWVAIDDPSENLRRLVGELESGLAELGFKPEPRDYRPHLTLGRTRSRTRRTAPEVIQRLQAEQDVRLGEMQADTVQLMGSFLEKRGPSYQVMDTIELG